MTSPKLTKKVVIVTILLLVCGISIVILSRPSQVTRANFVKLTNGMTKSQVETIFGERGEAWDPGKTDAGGEYLCWIGDGVAYLIFDKSALLFKEWHEDEFLSPTRQQFERVMHGMTRDEVLKLFGRQPDAAAGFRELTVQEIWVDVDGHAAVSFDHERVFDKSFSQMAGDNRIEYERNRPLQRFIRSWLETRP